MHYTVDSYPLSNSMAKMAKKTDIGAICQNCVFIRSKGRKNHFEMAKLISEVSLWYFFLRIEFRLHYNAQMATGRKKTALLIMGTQFWEHFRYKLHQPNPVPWGSARMTGTFSGQNGTFSGPRECKRGAFMGPKHIMPLRPTLAWKCFGCQSQQSLRFQEGQGGPLFAERESQ